MNSRAVTFGSHSVIAPIWDLVNHDVISLPFFRDLDGLSTPNYPPMNGEITFSYNNKSPLNRFFSYGFFSRETIVFSFPFSINFKKLGIFFICKGEELNDDSIKIYRFENTIIIDGLPIANVNHPKLPDDYFDEIIRRIADFAIPKDTFIKILELNLLVRQNMLKESQLIDNEVSKMFSEIINYEINLISSYD